MAETIEDVRTIIVELLGVDAEKVVPEAFEEKFGGEISDEDAQQITTVGEAVKYIDEKMK